MLKRACQIHSALIYLSSQNLYAFDSILQTFKMINSILLVYSALWTIARITLYGSITKQNSPVAPKRSVNFHIWARAYFKALWWRNFFSFQQTHERLSTFVTVQVAKLKIPDRFKVASIPALVSNIFTVCTSGNIHCEVANHLNKELIVIINGA